jgi:hypothetical protein
LGAIASVVDYFQMHDLSIVLLTMCSGTDEPGEKVVDFLLSVQVS